MKKIILIVVLALALPATLPAQNNTIDGIINKYTDKEGYTYVNISKYMFELFSNFIGDEEDKDVKALMSQLNGIKILTSSNENTRGANNLYNEVMSNMKSNTYKELMSIKEANENVKFMIKEENSKINELFMLVGEAGETTLISLQGNNIDLKQLSKLSKALNVKGLEKMNKIDEKKIEEKQQEEKKKK